MFSFMSAFNLSLGSLFSFLYIHSTTVFIIAITFLRIVSREMREKLLFIDVNSLQLGLPRSEGCQTFSMRQILQKSINSHSLMFNMRESRHDRVMIVGNSTKHLIKISQSRLVSSSTKIDNLLSFASLFSFVCECFGWRSGDLWIDFSYTIQMLGCVRYVDWFCISFRRLSIFYTKFDEKNLTQLRIIFIDKQILFFLVPSMIKNIHTQES